MTAPRAPTQKGWKKAAAPRQTTSITIEGHGLAGWPCQMDALAKPAALSPHAMNEMGMKASHRSSKSPHPIARLTVPPRAYVTSAQAWSSRLPLVPCSTCGNLNRTASIMRVITPLTRMAVHRSNHSTAISKAAPPSAPARQRDRELSTPRLCSRFEMTMLASARIMTPPVA